MMLWSILVPVIAVVFHLPRAVQSCMNGDIRLAGADKTNTGRVEFCYEGEWGTVCDDLWDEEDARVVCRQLGLPTKVVSAILGFGGGSGKINIDNTVCNGSELRLEDCMHNGIRNHNCEQDEHNEDAGVICHPDDEDTSCYFDEQTNPLEDPVLCGDNGTQYLPSRACVYRHGVCVPFYPAISPTVCDSVYKAGVDYVYVPKNRSRGSYSRLIRDVGRYGPFLLEPLLNCFEPARQLLCHFYFPPCGNVTHFHPPTTVCSEECKTISQMCPEEWASIVERFNENDAIIATEGLQLINCDFPGKHLAPLPHCCSDLGLNISISSKNEERDEPCSSTSSRVYIGSGVAAAILVLTALFAVPIWCIVFKWYQRPKRMVISNPQSYHGSQLIKQSSRIIIDEEPLPVTERYTLNEDMMSTLRVREEGTQMPRVVSGFLRQMSEDNLLVPEEKVHLVSIVGQGEFGAVYRGTLNDWKEYTHHTVAVKTLKAISSSSNLKHLVEESQIMSRFNHPNVMKLLGVSISIGRTLYVIMPFMAQGSLLSFLRKNRADLTVENEDMIDLIEDASSRLLSMCLQITKGMAYLASQKFIHRDLAARNCMIDQYNVIKVADFGLSEDVYARNYFRQMSTQEEDGETAVKLPVRWMALESLNDGIFSEKTDVWSFGVTCWEVFSLGKNPYPGVDPFSLIRYLESGERLDKPLNAACSQDIYCMIRGCWNKFPEERPTFSELVALISTSLEEMAGYFDFTTPSFSAELTLNTDPQIAND